MSNIRLEYTKPQSAAAVRATRTRAELGRHIGQALGEVLAYLKNQGLEPAGPPFAHYLHLDPSSSNQLDVVTGWPVAQPVKAGGNVIPWILPGGKSAVGTHTGAYINVVATCQEILDWAAKQKLQPEGSLIELYVTNPETERDQSKWRTEIFIPIK